MSNPQDPSQQAPREAELVQTVRRAEGYGAGKVILLGEHSVVYGRPALAAGLPDGVTASLRPVAEGPGRVHCEAWSLDVPLDDPGRLGAAVRSVLAAGSLDPLGWSVELRSQLPHSSGLGSSAALCVAVARAAGQMVGMTLTDEEAASTAFEGERCFHGTPSGIDNTIAAFGGLLWFRKPDQRHRVHLRVPLPLVIAHSGRGGETAAQVAGVRERYQHEPERYEALFDEMASLVAAALDALALRRIEILGELMDRCHESLRQLGVSSAELDEMVLIARSAGALGAKLTGAGGGGCILALAPDRPQRVLSALERAGYRGFVRVLPPTE